MSHNNLIIGIDPGLQGFFTIMFPDGRITHFPMPLKKRRKRVVKKKKRDQKTKPKEYDEFVDGKVLADTLHWAIVDSHDQIYSVKIMIEDVHSIFNSSAKSNFNFGGAVQKLHGVLEAEGYEYDLVQPKTWQKEIWTDEDIKNAVYKKPEDRTKAISIAAAKRLFPEIDLRKSSRTKICHDGKADSLLIAEYLRRSLRNNL